MPSSKAYAKAFSALASHWPDVYVRLLRAHYRAPNHMITASDLAKAVGWKSYRAANLHYGLLAGLVGDYLHIRDRTTVNEKAIATWIFPGEQNNDELILIMRPEVAGAVKMLGWD